MFATSAPHAPLLSTKMEVKQNLKTDLQTWKSQTREFGVHTMDLCMHSTGDTTTSGPTCYTVRNPANLTPGNNIDGDGLVVPFLLIFVSSIHIPQK